MKVQFYELDMEQKISAVDSMFLYKKKHDYPFGADWPTIEDLRWDLEQGYCPDDHFSFFLDEFGGVDTKMK